MTISTTVEINHGPFLGLGYCRIAPSMKPHIAATETKLTTR